MLDARLELTTTLICRAALPRIAGPIMRAIWRSPGWFQSIRGRKPNPARHIDGNCHNNCNTPPGEDSERHGDDHPAA